MRAFAIAAALLLTACVRQPSQPDPYSPWFNIPKPTKCGPHCKEWVEPGMFVHEVRDEL